MRLRLDAAIARESRVKIHYAVLREDDPGWIFGVGADKFTGMVAGGERDILNAHAQQFINKGGYADILHIPSI